MSVPPLASCSCLSELLLVPLPCYPWPLGRTLHRISRFEGDPHCIEGTLLALLARARCMSEESEVSYAARFVGGRPRPCTRLAAYSITACLTLCMASSSPTASFSTFLALHTCVFCKTCKLSESKLTASSLHNFGKSSPNCLIKKLCMGFGSKFHCKDSRRSRCRTCPSISSGRKKTQKQKAQSLCAHRILLATRPP